MSLKTVLVKSQCTEWKQLHHCSLKKLIFCKFCYLFSRSISIWQHPAILVCLLLQLAVPGPPFVFGGFLVIMAMMVAIFMPVSPRIIIVRDVSKCDPPLQLVDQPTISSDFLGTWCDILYLKHVLHSSL